MPHCAPLMDAGLPVCRRQKIGKKITKLEKEFIAVEEELEDFEALDLEEAEAEAERLATRAMAALRDIASAKTS